MSDQGTPDREGVEDAVDLDAVDEGVLHALQRDARNITTEEIAEEVDVSPSTVRNRIAKLERTGVIEGYEPKIDYEQGGFPLHVLFVCTADPEERGSVAQDVLGVSGVTNVMEMLTSEQNIYIEVIATSTNDLGRITSNLNEKGLIIHSSEIVTSDHSQPWGHFEVESPR